MPGRLVLAVIGLMLISPGQAQSCPPASSLAYTVIDHTARDGRYFTQGLVFVDTVLAESTGLYGRSQIILHHPGGREHLNLPKRLFGEGLALHNQRLWQLSWKAGQLRVYTLRPLALEKTLRYSGQGWGLAHDGQRFIRSDGSATLHFHHSADFQPMGQLNVREGERPIARLNELEWANGHLLANIWFSERIARIDPDSGCVDGWLDLGGLWPQAIRPDHADVLNGMAWHAGRKELWVTGKNWPRIYRLDVPALKSVAEHGEHIKTK